MTKIKEWEEYKEKHSPPKKAKEFFVKVQMGWLTIPVIMIWLIGVWQVIAWVWNLI